ncbi:hypothetical protein Syn7502_01158 [Synechococcus sp. PCC 7502]|uniref:hypothetical protein n=1 Tax=Synechococcus sp. PCC 7502 TaxID=1173263 RepID=UPI00029FA6E4|nr:hypothetical protein [Synechococcus sp. PCC 7502]AFY73266.1 hypothetical protein Syn7502_01158 [Synechococcus sp. PCC 7502]
MTPKFLDKHKASELISLSEHTLKQKRSVGEFIEGLHYVRLGRTSLRYNSEVLLIWMQYRNDAPAYQRAIEAYLNLQPDNQDKIAGRKKR